MPNTKPTAPRGQKSIKDIQELRVNSDIQENLATHLQQQSSQSDVDTRQHIAKNFIRWYFVLFLTILIGLPVFNLFANQITGGNEYKLDLLDVIQGFSSVVGPLVGFVIAYYFKSKND